MPVRDDTSEHTVQRMPSSARALAAVHVLLIAVLILSFQYLPLQDYPDWVYQGMLFREYIFGGNDFGGAFVLHRYLAPNAISTVLIGGLSLVVDPLVAGKIVLLIATLLLYAGIYHFLSITVERRHELLLSIAFLFTFNYSFWLGNLSYTFGLGIALLGAWLLIRKGWIESFPCLLIVVTLCYVSHFFSYFFILFTAGVWILLEQRPRLLRKLSLAALPTLLIFAHYLLSKGDVPTDSDPVLSIVRHIYLKLTLFAGAIIPFQRVKGFGDVPWPFAVSNLIVAGGMAVLCLIALRMLLRERRFDLNIVLALPLPLLIFFLPFYSSGIVYPGQRLVLFFLLNIIAYLLVRHRRSTRSLLIVSMLVGFAVYGYAVYCSARFDGIAGDRDSRANVLPAGEEARGGTDGFIRLRYYDAIRERRPIDIFPTGLFYYRPIDSAVGRE